MTSRGVDEDVKVLLSVVADGQLVREVTHGNVRPLAEHQARILVVLEAVAEALSEVAPLLALGAEPGDRPIRQHTVQDHQALDRAADHDSPAVPVVRLADCCVERLVVNVEDPRPSGRSELDRSHEPADQ
jgi:hypothetical protein